MRLQPLGHPSVASAKIAILARDASQELPNPFAAFAEKLAPPLTPAKATHVGKRWDTDAAFGGRIRRGGYTVANLKGRYRIDENFELFGRIENALARRYLEPDGFEQPGRAGYLGVKATY